MCACARVCVYVRMKEKEQKLLGGGFVYEIKGSRLCEVERHTCTLDLGCDSRYLDQRPIWSLLRFIHLQL